MDTKYMDTKQDGYSNLILRVPPLWAHFESDVRAVRCY